MPLTGHPAQGCDIGPLRFFHVPGQDLVWRWVLPDHPSALEGCEATQAKCSASAMLHGGRRRNANECCGAYGHELTWDEMTWLANWCFIRGVNWLFPHAFYYSVRRPALGRAAAGRGPPCRVVGPLPGIRGRLPPAELAQHRLPARLRHRHPGPVECPALAAGEGLLRAPARLQLPGGAPPVGGRGAAWPAGPGGPWRHPFGRHALPGADRGG